jgi:NADH:ubiquinone oxidoreductase subunit E
MSRLASMGLELEDIADGETVRLDALVDLAEERGRPASHYLAALVMTELRLPQGATTVRVCAGNCQQYGALDLLDHLAARKASIAPVGCLDRCDKAPACEVVGAHGTLVLAPATAAAIDEALAAL